MEEWVFIFLKEIDRDYFPFKSAMVSRGPRKTLEGTSQNQYISILCDSGKGHYQPGIRFSRIFKQIFVGRLLCSKYHAVYILFSMEWTTWAYLVHETEPRAILLCVVFMGLTETRWPTEQPSTPSQPPPHPWGETVVWRTWGQVQTWNQIFPCIVRYGCKHSSLFRCKML